LANHGHAGRGAGPEAAAAERKNRRSNTEREWRQKKERFCVIYKQIAEVSQREVMKRTKKRGN